MKKILELLDKIYSDSDYAKSIASDLFPVSIAKDQGEYLSHLVKEHRPNVLVELGFGYGISSLWINSRYQPAKHIMVDPFRPKARNDLIYKVVKKLKNTSFRDDISSQNFLANYSNGKRTVDMFFIDADEHFDAVIADMFFVTKILKINGIVVVRNMWNPSVRKAIMFYCRNLPYDIIGFTKLDSFIFNKFPVIRERLFYHKFRQLDFAVLKLKGEDKRFWNHFNNFS